MKISSIELKSYISWKHARLPNSSLLTKMSIVVGPIFLHWVHTLLNLFLSTYLSKCILNTNYIRHYFPLTACSVYHHCAYKLLHRSLLNLYPPILNLCPPLHWEKDWDHPPYLCLYISLYGHPSIFFAPGIKKLPAYPASL